MFLCCVYKINIQPQKFVADRNLALKQEVQDFFFFCLKLAFNLFGHFKLGKRLCGCFKIDIPDIILLSEYLWN